MPTCERCGAELPLGAAFCPPCGARAVSQGGQPYEAEQGAENAAPGRAVTGRGSDAEGDPAREPRTIAALSHLAAFAGLAIPFGNVLGPLIVWLARRDDSPFIDDHGKQALNFQLSL